MSIWRYVCVPTFSSCAFLSGGIDVLGNHRLDGDDRRPECVARVAPADEVNIIHVLSWSEWKSVRHEGQEEQGKQTFSPTLSHTHPVCCSLKLKLTAYSDPLTTSLDLWRRRSHSNSLAADVHGPARDRRRRRSGICAHDNSGRRARSGQGHFTGCWGLGGGREGGDAAVLGESGR